MAGETDFAMDAKVHINGRLPSRHVTEGAERVLFAAVMNAASESVDAALHPVNDIAEIFKKTPCAAGLKPPGRFVAKDMHEVGSIPMLMKTLLANGHPDGDCITVTGRTIAETLKRMEIDGEAGTFNSREPLDVKLTDAEPAEHETKWRPRATNKTLGALWKFAQGIGPAVDGAVIHPCGAHEKQCYANI
jgi:dihydroxyacid dehydratase/phosphogluconate dehydratase